VSEATWWPLAPGLLTGARDRTDPVYGDASTDRADERAQSKP
jgi:hypothetical protein